MYRRIPSMIIFFLFECSGCLAPNSTSDGRTISATDSLPVSVGADQNQPGSLSLENSVELDSELVASGPKFYFYGEAKLPPGTLEGASNQTTSVFVVNASTDPNFCSNLAAMKIAEGSVNTFGVIEKQKVGTYASAWFHQTFGVARNVSPGTRSCGSSLYRAKLTDKSNGALLTERPDFNNYPIKVYFSNAAPDTPSMAKATYCEEMPNFISSAKETGAEGHAFDCVTIDSTLSKNNFDNTEVQFSPALSKEGRIVNPDNVYLFWGYASSASDGRRIVINASSNPNFCQDLFYSAVELDSVDTFVLLPDSRESEVNVKTRAFQVLNSPNGKSCSSPFENIQAKLQGAASISYEKAVTYQSSRASAAQGPGPRVVSLRTSFGGTETTIKGEAAFCGYFDSFSFAPATVDAPPRSFKCSF